MTEITNGDGRPAAVLIHDPTLDTDSDLLEGLAATSLMLLENTRLVDELARRRARGSWRPPIASAVGSSAIFTTAPSSG